MESKAHIHRARRRLVKLHVDAQVGHLGSALSCFDAMMVLFHDVMAQEDHFVLSKGHAASALYTCLWSCDLLEEAELNTFAQDGSPYPCHPTANSHPHIQFSTGSLGHGLSLATGLAMGLRYQNKAGRVFCLMSDGEWQAGGNWEALWFAQKQALDNLVVVIDANGLQAFDRVRDVVGAPDLAEKIRSHGIEVNTIDGHDPEALGQAFTGPKSWIVLNTIKGNHMLEFADQIASHYVIPNTSAST